MIEGTCLCGAIRWRFDGTPEDATACNCTVCRRYGVLWAYDWVDGRISLEGPATAWSRNPDNPNLEFLFCATCGCVAAWRATKPWDCGRTRIAVNLRLADPNAVADIPLLKFDGLDSFKDLPPGTRRVRDIWF